MNSQDKWRALKKSYLKECDFCTNKDKPMYWRSRKTIDVEGKNVCYYCFCKLAPKIEIVIKDKIIAKWIGEN